MNIDDFLASLKEADRKPIRRFWNWLLPKGIADMYAGYALLRAHKIVRHYALEVKYAWQRVFRGWDDRVIWSIDWYLSEKLPIWLAQLKKDKYGVPGVFFDYDEDGNETTTMEEGTKRWDAELDKMIDGFSAAYRIQNEHLYGEEHDEAYALFKIGIASFTKYYFNLWD